MHEKSNNQSAALLADVEDVELVPGNRFGDWQDAVLIVPPYLSPGSMSRSPQRSSRCSSIALRPLDVDNQRQAWTFQFME
ncbi:hypothetical protein HEP84_58450 [Streptomyces sp. RLB1-33]